MLIQTDLNSFSYKLGLIVPWCKRCGMKNCLIKDGKSQGKQRFRCKHCGFRFVWTSDLPKRRFYSRLVMFVVDWYHTGGNSLREIARKLWRHFKIKISHETIRLWNLVCSKLNLPTIQPTYSPIWHADETYIKINGIGFWLWIVYCEFSRAVLAWHISKSRFFKDARTLFEKAKFNTGMRPQKIITDGLWAYKAAIKKVFGWRFVKHEEDSGFGKNAILERFNEEVKRRTKWFRTFQSIEGAEAFCNLFFYHYNQYHINRTTGTTPAKMACCSTNKTLADYLRPFPSPEN